MRAVFSGVGDMCRYMWGLLSCRLCRYTWWTNEM